MIKSRNEYYQYIKEKVSIKEVCDKLGIVTKSVGDDYVCSCIYHRDPHPSMHIYTGNKSFYCFECDRGGNIYTLLQQKLECNFHGTINWLEREYPQILEEKPRLNAKLDWSYDKTGYEIALNKYAAMTETEEKHLQLFAESRGYESEFLRECEIFYVRGKKLHDAFVRNEDSHIEEIEKLKETHLLSPVPMGIKDQKIHYEDYFHRDRVVITLRDGYGKICGFAGRSVRKDDKPKYLFTKGLPKAQILYRLDSAERHLRRKHENQKLFIVEGIFDALRLETMGKCAVAVLGNRLVDKQIKLLEGLIDRLGVGVTLSLFLDTDTAGLNGTIASIKRIWKNKVLKKCYLEVQILKDGNKDPDEAFNGKSSTEGVHYTAFEFLMRYYLKEEKPLPEVDIKTCYTKLNTEERISLLHKMEDILPRQEWEELFECYDRVTEIGGEEENASDSVFSYLKIRSFILGIQPPNVNRIQRNKTVRDKNKIEEEKDYQYQMHTSLQIARTSYDREEVPLDDTTWERIALSADAFFDYLYVMLKNREVISVPMITMQVPKKLMITRKKAMCCHEELLLQQYVLNELLTRGGHEGFERNIPAVRYEPGIGVYVTGYQYQELTDEAVCFAYQVDMLAISGMVEIKKGMYRPFYDCWESYIQYIQDGIEKLESEVVYRVKLDVQGFYDNLRNFIIRDAILPSIEEALRYDGEKFKCFNRDNIDIKEKAEAIVEWILKELFKEEYYDSKDGSLKQKTEYDCGIPQGPNLSSYAANIALFSLDQKVQKIVKEVNQGCEEGKIRARYARYVDDMIIVASSPAVLLRIKGAVATRLYEMNLSLSPKTDEEDGISKEDAIDWTMEERGGFGVSAGFDMPDDTIESLMDEYEDYEVTDRRGALKLLQSSLNALLYEGMVEQEGSWERFFTVFFQTREIRYLDIVRFSEMMIYHAVKQPRMLTDAFQRMWETGTDYAQNDSLFLEKGLEALVLLDGCRRILLRQEIPGNPESYSAWEIVDKKIKEEKKEICEWVLASISNNNILEINRWIINLKLMEFYRLTGGYIEDKIKSADCCIEGQNEYWYRWRWHSAKNRQELMELRPKLDDEKSVIQDFHFFVEAFRRIEKTYDFMDIKSILRNYETYENVGEDLLLDCFKSWATQNRIEKVEDAERALRVLLNTIPSDFKAEIIEQMEGLKEYLFSVNEDAKIYEYLPVYPGVRYPGIMMAVKENKYITGVKRVDLSLEPEMVLSEECWKLDNEAVDNKRKYFERELENSSIKYISLKDYCSSITQLNAQKALQIIVSIYPMLNKTLSAVNEQILKKAENKKLILSSRNVLLKIQENEICGIDVESAYLISSQKTPDVVAIEAGNEQYKLQVVYSKGAAYWIGGYLLKDACKVDSIRLIAFEQGEDEKRDAEMLRFSMRRLYGHAFQTNGAHYRGEKSYEKSVDRTIGLIKDYLACSNAEKVLFLEDARIINSFIEKKLDNEYGEFLNQAWGCAVWAKNYLRFGFSGLKKVFEEQKGAETVMCKTERRVPKWYYYLALHIEQLYRKNKFFYGFKALAAGIYADAVLMLMRMQVLECIKALDGKQRRSFLNEADDFPFRELRLEEKEIFITEGDLSLVYRNFLLNRKDEDGVKSITHLGWLLLLAKIYEIDKKADFIVFDTKRKIDRELLGEKIRTIVEIISAKPEKSKQKEAEFPFEKMEGFFQVWNKENVSLIFQCLSSADSLYGTVVNKMESAGYRQKKEGKGIIIDTGREIYKEQNYFLTFGKASSGIQGVETKIENPSQFIYSQTVIRGRVVGISAISNEFGQVLQQWEDEKLHKKKLDVVDDFLSGQQEKTVEKSVEFREIQSEKDSLQRESEVYQTNDEKNDPYFKFQSTAWSRRGKTKFFVNADRIALFQFQIDSSYAHPEVEKCRLKEKKDEQNLLLYNSCAEFRRRKLLKPVLLACKDFGVEILLLPEYSIRPETIQWMYETMQQEECKFSIWAGTFRIPAGYHFDGNETIDMAELNEEMFWHSAPLPIILNTGNKEAEIIIKKFKKYPAVALKEDINTAPAYELYDKLSPIIHRYVAEKQTAGRRKDAEGERNVMPYFYDARDDIIELICAELFAVASISNYPSFLKESLTAYSNYKKPNFLENKGIYEQYEKKYLNDVQQFGKYTALYQQEERYIRTPILLVPACATRAVDYYVFGQDFYLSTGLKTVFCNAVGNRECGGSCFIGPDSWDNKKIKSDEYFRENTIYHGLKPGIFMQTSEMKNRGALGAKEQALLICDVYPELDKRSPNAESMMSAFSLVAHIPIFEEKNYDYCLKKEAKCRYCSKYEMTKAEERRKATDCALEQIRKHCEKKFKNTVYYHEEASDNDKMKNVVNALKYLGETYQSDGLVERAEYYEKYYKMYPQAWPPPALTDWIYVEIDYETFMEGKEEAFIQIPPTNLE